jgi:hypothetical protein
VAVEDDEASGEVDAATPVVDSRRCDAADVGDASSDSRRLATCNQAIMVTSRLTSGARFHNNT